MGIWVNSITGLLALFIGHMAPLPPLEYNYTPQKEIKITFDTSLNVHIKCGGSIPEFIRGHEIFACAGVGRDWVIMPDPCYHKEESYARVLCHELGHSNGWPADHPGAVRYISPTEAQSIPQSVDKTPQ